MADLSEKVEEEFRLASSYGGSNYGPNQSDSINIMRFEWESPVEEDMTHVVIESTNEEKPNHSASEAKDKNENSFAHLPQIEADILRRQIDIPEVKTGWSTLYRYATFNDKLIIAVATVCAVASGAALPLMTVLYGQLAGKFDGYFSGAVSRSAFRELIGHQILFLVYIGVAEFVTVYVSIVGFIYTGEHISGKIRARYLEACMRQNIGFFDQMGSGEVTTRITADMNLVQDGISEKVALTLNALGTFFTAFIIGFIKSWKLTLILSVSCVALILIVGGGSSFNIRYNKQSLQSYALGGTVAEEAISSIRNAVAFGTQDRLAKRYDTHLAEAQKYGFKYKRTFSLMVGGMNLVIYLTYGLAFWMGSRLLVSGEVDLASILTILMAIMMGAFSLGNVTPNAQAFTTAISAAAKIFNTIDRVSPLDSSSDEGYKVMSVQGSIELKHIKHVYPSRPEVTVMNDVNLLIPAGKKTALVGASGSGKSTIVGLVERFYDPVGGHVLLDGHDISLLNLRWLRQQISLVSQEPVLFGTTIYENIAHGLIGTKFEYEREDSQQARVIQAAKMANAHNFICDLPEGYDTNVGERGSLLSGGQKQRIAIARAIISDPKILLLDEATSALDTKSEGIVQATLDVAAAGRTTIVVAHRLSTIKDADNIVVMSGGRIVEQGTHDVLLKIKGVYHSLVEAQTIAETNRMSADEEALIDEADTRIAMKRYSSVKRDSWGGYLNFEEEVDDKSLDEKLDMVLLGKPESPFNTILQLWVGEGNEYSLWTLIKWIISFNSREWYWMLLGLVFSIVCGGGQPTQEVFVAEQIVALSTPLVNFTTGQPIPGASAYLRSHVNFWSLMYLMLAFVQLFSYWIQGISFAVCSERLILRLRSLAFRAMLRQDIAFFDQEGNTAGSLTSFLSTETTYVSGLSGVTLGTILILLTTLVTSCIIALAFAWKLALVCISTIPILIGCGFLRFWLISQFHKRAQETYEKSASYACEATSAMRTVASLTRESDVLKQYEKSLNVQARNSLHSVMKSSLLFSASQSLVFLCIGLGFWYGGNQIADGKYNLFQFFVAFSSVIFGAQAAGTIFSFAPDMGKGKQAAQKLKVLFDRQPEIDTGSPTGQQVTLLQGHIEFRNIHFRYPTRPEQPVLRGLNLTVKPGQYIALVGASGCGKSTTIALLERFYDPLVGNIYVDGTPLSRLNITNYRSHIALVSQEPTLYQGTIRENILMGLDDHNDETTIPDDEAIASACREANIYDFIISLPEGFDTVVGSKGSMLSGGQKQRIAIARALVRNPAVLLLDEATSALDSESERVVQAALDRAARGRTTIAVAHRLSTIQKADVIYVLDRGVVVESGDHASLMGMGGRYAELVKLQSLGVS